MGVPATATSVTSARVSVNSTTESEKCQRRGEQQKQLALPYAANEKVSRALGRLLNRLWRAWSRWVGPKPSRAAAAGDRALKRGVRRIGALGEQTMLPDPASHKRGKASE